jgi:hypothetical protein
MLRAYVYRFQAMILTRQAYDGQISNCARKTKKNNLGHNLSHNYSQPGWGADLGRSKKPNTHESFFFALPTTNTE